MSVWYREFTIRGMYVLNHADHADPTRQHDLLLAVAQ